MRMINNLLIPQTEHQINNYEHHKNINNLMTLMYVQYRILKYNHYTPGLFHADSKVGNIYNIKIGFQCYYLISKIWANNGEPSLNIVQISDKESTLIKYWRLLTGVWFKLKNCTRRYQPITNAMYKPFVGDQTLCSQATQFFDSHSSRIEIVMPDGSSAKRNFHILPQFLAFTQDEKDRFWIDANLDNSKTVINSLVEFAEDKIDELSILQDIQTSFLCPRDLAMKTNWLTTLIKILIIVMNFSLFFALEINEGKTLDHPQLFGMNSDLTNAILYTFGFVILILFCYITIIQGIIVLKLQYTRAFSEHDESKKIKLSHKLLKPFSYIMSNFEETMQ